MQSPHSVFVFIAPYLQPTESLYGTNFFTPLFAFDPIVQGAARADITLPSVASDLLILDPSLN
jgi:hypothetical protein